MPMMQYSVAPWRVLSKEYNEICKQAAELHTEMGAYILKLAKEASISGEPIVKPMEYVYPEKDYEMIKDQYVLGHDIIVAPIVEKGARSRKVVLPKGKWKADDGKVYEGDKIIEIKVPLDRLPYFKNIRK